MADEPAPATNEQLAGGLDPTWKFWVVPAGPVPDADPGPPFAGQGSRAKYVVALVALVVLLVGGFFGWLLFGRSNDDGAAAASSGQPGGTAGGAPGAAVAPSASPSPAPSSTATTSSGAATTTTTTTSNQPVAAATTPATSTQPAAQTQPPQSTTTNSGPSPSVTQPTQEPPKETTVTSTPPPPPSPSPSPPSATATSPGQWAYTITNATSTCDDQVKSSVGTAFAPLNVTVMHTGGSFSLQVSATNTLSGSIDAGGNFSLVSNLTSTPGPGSLSIRAMQGRLNGSPGGTADGSASLIGTDQCVVTVTFHLVLSNPV